VTDPSHQNPLLDASIGAADRGVALLPLGPVSASDPLAALVAAREGMALSWEPPREGALTKALHVLPPTALVATGLVAAAEAARAGSFVAGSGTLYQAINPAGQSLVASSAVPGGFLSATTAAGSSQIAGGAVFVPAAGAAAALLPVAALAATVVGVQLWSHHQLSKKLTKIQKSIDALQQAWDEREESRFVSSIQTLDLASLVWMDDPNQDLERLVPGFGNAAADLRTQQVQARKNIATWREELDELSTREHVYARDFKKTAFGGPRNDPRRFLPYQMIRTDLALESHQRLAMLQLGVAAARESTESPLIGFRERVSAQLGEDSDLRLELRSILDVLMQLPHCIGARDAFSDEPVRVVQGLMDLNRSLPTEPDPRRVIETTHRELTYTVASDRSVNILAAA
jgi:hypothetical protein